MRTRLLFLLLLVALLALFCNVKFGHADCTFGCLFQPGTKCVDNNCVQIDATPTPSPTQLPTSVNEIRLLSQPSDKIVAVPVDCAGLDLKTVKVILTRTAPPPFATFYSMVFWFQPDSSVVYYGAQKDVLNRYVFLPLGAETVKPQFVGLDFKFTDWNNPAFAELLSAKTCTELKTLKWFYQFGIIVDGRTEGAAFYFK